MRSAAAALQKLLLDPHDLGADISCLAVLHTWTRAVLYHPHVHVLVTAGRPSLDGSQWVVPKHPAFFLPVEALSVIFRAKVRAALKHAGLLEQAPPQIWKKPWVVEGRTHGSILTGEISSADAAPQRQRVRRGRRCGTGAATRSDHLALG